MVIKTASPGVLVNEIDLTRGNIDAISTNIGAICGPFQKGPVDKFVLINTEAELQRVFGNPTDENYEYWWSVNNFLDYGGVCYVIRCDDEVGSQTLKTASNAGSAIYVKNEDDFVQNWEGEVGSGNFIARNPGVWGNSLGVAIIDAGADYQVDLKSTGVVDDDNVASTDLWDKTTAGGVLGGTYYRVVSDAITAPVGAFLTLWRASTRIGTAYVTAVTGNSRQLFVSFLPTYTSLLVTDTISITLVGTVKVAINTVYSLGEFLHYSSDSVVNNRANLIFSPGTFTLLQGLNYGLPASPTDRRKANTTQGDSYVYDAASLTWKSAYKLKEDDRITDGDNIFLVGTVSDWYSNQVAFQGVPWYRFASRPGTSRNAVDRGCFNDEMNIIIYDTTGNITGSKGNVLEQYFGVSKLASAITPEGEINYYRHVITTKSNYVFASLNLTPSGTLTALNTVFDTDAVGTTIANDLYCSYVNATRISLTGGVDNLTATLGELQSAYNKFNVENVDNLDYIIQGPGMSNFDDSVAKANFLISIAEDRRDCMVFISPYREIIIGQSDSERITDSIVTFAKELSSSSYAVFDSGYKYSYDRFNDVYRYMPLNADTAGLMAYTSIVAEPWYSPAGMSRGQIRNVVRLAYNPSPTQRDELFANRVNPVVTFPGEGTILFGDKTALGYSSAFDRINVRKLFLVVERAIAKSSRTNLFEFNDEITRSLFKNNTNPFLRNVQARRGMADFLVVCDTSNNTPEIIDRNEFVADIYIKPSRSINYIGLNFVATKTGVTFDESVGLFRGTNQSTNR